MKKQLLAASIFIFLGLFLVRNGLQENKTSINQESILPSPVVEGTAFGNPDREGQKTWVTRVIDGDTIEISGGEKVRYIGIDTPETIDPRRGVGCFGKEASAKNKELVAGQEVYLLNDISETDKFGRLLRYVYLKKDKNVVFINDYLVREGFARVSTYPPDVKFSSQFVDAEREARESQKGLWKKCL